MHVSTSRYADERGDREFKLGISDESQVLICVERAANGVACMTHSNSQLGKSRKVHADVRLLLIAVNLVGSTLTANLQQVVLQPQNLQASSACAAWPKLERKVHRVQCPLMAVFTQALLQTKAPCVHGVMLVQYATLLYLDLDSLGFAVSPLFRVWPRL